MDTADDAILEWSDSAYSEHSSFIDLPTGLLCFVSLSSACFRDMSNFMLLLIAYYYISKNRLLHN